MTVVTTIGVMNAGHGRGHRDCGPPTPGQGAPGQPDSLAQRSTGLQNGAIGWHNTGPAGQKASEDGRRGLSRDGQPTAVTR
jgi:hypothetical protein